LNSLTRRSFSAAIWAVTATASGIGRLAAAAPAPSKQLPSGEYPVDPNVLTTAERTIVPAPTPATRVEIFDIAQYDRADLGAWTYGKPDAPVVRVDLMPAGYAPAAVDQRRRLLTFFAISDIHITDKEAPNQGIYIQRLHPELKVITSLCSGVMLYTTHVLDAAVQTINLLHKKQPFDFGLSLGDAANSTQYNELRWYIDVLDGKMIHPSSGAHLGADSIDFQKPFKAVGLDKSIPWYQVLGNHDHFWLGSVSVDHGPRADLRQSYVADEVFAAGDVLADPSRIVDRTYYMGVFDGSKPYGDVKFAGAVKDFASAPKVAPDPDRRSLTTSEWLKEFFNTSSSPAGHGFSLADAEKGFGCFSFVPKAGVPIKVISLDDTQKDDDKSLDIHGHGFLDAARWAWLKKELADGDAAGQLMIIAAHIPIGVEPSEPRSEMSWWLDPQNAVTLPDLLKELHSHPNLLMWLAGHRHLNTVKAFLSPDPVNAPEQGFWHVETSSLRDFPQQLRTFEIFVNGDYSVSIETINVDPSVEAGTPAAISRRYAVAAQQLVKTDISTFNPTKDPTIAPMPSGSYNAKLAKRLSPEMTAKLKALYPTL
jgi:metallophosphoesterase (TIGR03768 family)